MSNIPTPPAPEFNPFATPNVASITNAAVDDVPLQKYSLVRNGLQLVYYSIAAIFLMAILIVVGAFVGFSSIGPGPNGGGPPNGFGFLMIAMGLGALGMFGAFIAMFVGFCLCLATPNSNEKPLATISVICLVLSIGLAMASGVLEEFASSALLAAVLSFIGNILQCVSTIAFCMFIRRVGENISSLSLQRSAKSALTWMGLLYGVALIGGVSVAILGGMSSVSGPSTGDLFAIIMIPFGLAMIVLGLGALFTYLAMLRTGINELKPKFYG